MKTIGILDSGLGGLLVLKRLIERFPHQSYIFLADQKNAPYGSLNKGQLIDILEKNIEWFQKLKIEEVVLACNTACSAALTHLQKKYPTMKIVGIIDETCAAIPNKDYKKIAVLATPFTANSHSYKEILSRLHSNWDVNEYGLTKLVMMIENQEPSSSIEVYLKEQLQGLSDVDAIILGCTHFPYVKEMIRKLFPVDIYDSNEVIVHMQKEEATIGSIEIYTTLDETRLRDQMKKLLYFDHLVNHVTI